MSLVISGGVRLFTFHRVKERSDMGVCVYVYGYVYGLRFMVKELRIPGDFFARFPEKNGRDFVDSQFSEFPLVCSQWTKDLKIWI